MDNAQASILRRQRQVKRHVFSDMDRSPRSLMNRRIAAICSEEQTYLEPLSVQIMMDSSKYFSETWRSDVEKNTC